MLAFPLNSRFKPALLIIAPCRVVWVRFVQRLCFAEAVVNLFNSLPFFLDICCEEQNNEYYQWWHAVEQNFLLLHHLELLNGTMTAKNLARLSHLDWGCEEEQDMIWCCHCKPFRHWSSRCGRVPCHGICGSIWMTAAEVCKQKGERCHKKNGRKIKHHAGFEPARSETSRFLIGPINHFGNDAVCAAPWSIPIYELLSDNYRTFFSGTMSW